MFLARQAAIFLCAAFPLLAAPKLTTIQDSIYRADGSRFNGNAVISWIPFDTSDNSKIGLQSLTVQITNGAFRVQLVPNADAIPANYYTVRYSSDGKQQFTESWSVPSSNTPLRIKDVRIAADSTSTGGTGGGVVQPPSQTPISESSVTGLLTDLSIRPVRGSAYTTGRAAVINDNGALDAATGSLSDCVRVDGSAGPCFDPATLPTFIDCETPNGIIDGSNASFTLANTPNPGSSLVLTLNGLAQQQNTDYSIQPDGTLLFASGAIPQAGDVLRASYRIDSSSSAIVVPQPLQTSARVQVLCNGSGAGVSSTTAVPLGSCTIPSHTLAIGDRVEVRFTFAHQGTSRGFNFLVRWGGATLVSRAASYRDELVTGRGDAAIGPAGTTLSVQTWGTTLALDSKVALTTDVLSSDIQIDFLGGLSSAGNDVVSLQNYTVLRYPAQ